MSRSVRDRLRKLGIKKGIEVIFSNELAERGLCELNEDQEKDPEEYRALDNLRVRIVPVLGTMPSIFGMSLAATVLCRLAGQPFK